MGSKARFLVARLLGKLNFFSVWKTLTLGMGKSPFIMMPSVSCSVNSSGRIQFIFGSAVPDWTVISRNSLNCFKSPCYRMGWGFMVAILAALCSKEIPAICQSNGSDLQSSEIRFNTKYYKTDIKREVCLRNHNPNLTLISYFHKME